MRTPENTAREISAARTLNTKRFVTPTGNRKLLASVAPIHYRDETGRLCDIATNDLVINDDTDEYVNNSLPFKFTLHRQGIGYTYASRAGGVISITLISIGNTLINQKGDYKVTRGNSKLTFHEVATDTDVVFELHRNGLRTYRVLKSSNAPREWRWAVAGDQAGVERISSRIVGRDASGKELSGLTLEVSDGRCIETWDGTAVSVDPRTRIKSQTASVTYPVTIDPDITENISDNNHDGRSLRNISNNNGDWEPSYDAIRFGNYSGNNYNYDAGFRFPSVGMSQGESIALAELHVNINGSSGSGSIGTLYGVDEDDASNFGSYGNQVYNKARTTASVAVSVGDSSPFDVTAIVQEIVDRAGYAGGAISFVFISSVANGTTRWIAIEDLQAAGTDEAQLEITLAATGNRRRRLLLLGT